MSVFVISNIPRSVWASQKICCLEPLEHVLKKCCRESEVAHGMFRNIHSCSTFISLDAGNPPFTYLNSDCQPSLLQLSSLPRLDGSFGTFH